MHKFLFYLILLHIFAVVTVQIGLTTESVRPVFTNIDAIEGLSDSDIIDRVGTAEIELELVNYSQDNSLRILVNGRIAGFFTENKMRISVRNNSLIQIDATTGEKIPYTVRISDISSNVSESCIYYQATTQKNIVNLGKIFLK